MKHARPDYDVIQAPTDMIPADEPVFLLRGQDRLAPVVIRQWAHNALVNGVDRRMIDAAMAQADAMDRWQKEHAQKMPDMPA